MPESLYPLFKIQISLLELQVINQKVQVAILLVKQLAKDCHCFD